MSATRSRRSSRRARVLLLASTLVLWGCSSGGEPSASPTPAPTTPSATAAPTAAGTSSGATSSGDSALSSGGTTATTSSKTYAGSVADTRWGPVQVQVTVSGGKVTAADVLQVPSGYHRDVEINSYAVPILNAEAVSAQSASIDTVSGATVTSVGYITSLQAALDQAGLS